jgi:hypothetical protein
MDDSALAALGQLLRAPRTAALGTLHAGGPFVSMVIFAAAPDFSVFYLHLSRLAQHTRDLAADPRASLMIAETDQSAARNPLALGRVSLQGSVAALPADAPEHASAKSLYLARFPAAEFNFTLGDFGLYAFTPQTGRYVGGFARAFDLTPADLRQAAARTAS